MLEGGRWSPHGTGVSMKRAIGVVLQVTLLVGLTTAVIGTVPASAVDFPSCTGTSLPANDDGSSEAVIPGFTFNFFNTDYTQLYVNNNGNVTFTGALGAFTPGPIVDGNLPIIAPFWADVDTTGAGSALTTYGTTTFGGHTAFCVSWDGVGYFDGHADKLNSFQLLLVDRSDVGAGDFDIVFNYKNLLWETGDASGGVDGFGGSSARAGYSDGQSNSFELPGSGINGGLLDSNGTTGLINNSTAGAPAGQYVYQVRNGSPEIVAPTITSPDSTTFTEGSQGDFTFISTGNPTPSISSTGTLPDGVLFDNANENGTAALSGTPALGTAGDYPLTITAGNGVLPNATQNFTLTVDLAVSAPNLTLTKSASPDPVQELNPITYTLDVGNNGSGDANDVVVTDTLPAGTTFDSASTTQGSCSYTAPTVTCNLGTLAAFSEGTQTVTIVVQAPNVTADTTITNEASVSASNAATVNASADTQVQVNTGGSIQVEVPPDSTVPLTYTTSTQSSNGAPAVDSVDKTAVSIVVPPGGPGGPLSLEELPCATAPCTGAAASPQRNAGTQAAKAKLVLGGVVFNVVPPPNYPNDTPFRVTLLYDKSLHPTKGPVYYFKPGVTPQEITLPLCGTTPPDDGQPCVLTNARITSGPALIKHDWMVVVRISSDPLMHR